MLLGHGDGQHRKFQGLVARAHSYVMACGFAVAAVDAPGHGDRPRAEQEERFAAGIKERMAAGEPIGPQIARYNTELSMRAAQSASSPVTSVKAPHSRRPLTGIELISARSR